MDTSWVLLPNISPNLVSKEIVGRGNEVQLGIGLFVSFLLLDIVWLLGKIESRQSSEYRLWRVREPCDALLANIRSSFVEIAKRSYGEKDLFVAHFTKLLHDLEAKITEVADKSFLRVQAEHFLSIDNVLDAFHGDTERIWRYTWELNREGKLFDELAWRRYFEKTASMVTVGEIKAIRAILIVDDIEALKVPRIAKLLDFFRTNDGLDCRIILPADYRQICADSGDAEAYEDFGIYGNQLLFLTERYQPAIVGIFTKDQEKVRRWKNLFDTMWNSTSVTLKNPSTAASRLTVEELLKFDAQNP